ncbi:coilin-like isoform X1 [Musa acuminata AAA Group]|uniref:coilin-like isoform X1 n=1 Tax=Musa acuminata AAA Group TaxID=214697 RepID=UPI0031DE5CCE
MAEPMRVRVEFEDRRLLTKSQRKDGLRRCWILLGPHLPTVADLAAHLARTFALNRSCPRGIRLYMDEFVLPPFESTSIFRDKDIIRVSKKAVKQRQLLGTCNSAYCMQDSENVVEESMHIDNNLLVHPDLPVNSWTKKRKKRGGSCDFQQNTTNIHAILSEETNLKKKEHMNKTQMLKRKKLNRSNTEKPIITAEPDENVLFEKNEHFVQKRSSLRRILNRKDGTSDGDGRCDSLISNRLHQAHSNYCRNQPESHANCKAERSEYPLLVDVSLLKTISTSDMQGDGSKIATLVNNWEVAVSVASAKESSTHVTEPMPNSDWGQMQPGLGERMKTQLQENRWDCWIANKISATPWPWAVSGRGAVATADGSFGGKWGNQAPAKYVTNLKSSKS